MNTKILKEIDGVKFVNLEQLWLSLKGEDLENRMTTFLKNSDVEFFDEKNQFVKKPSVMIAGIGGLPINWSEETPANEFAIFNDHENTTIKELRESVTKMLAFGGYMSYLNPKDRSPEKFVEMLLSQNHFSTAHMININLLISGVSTSVENEFCCQRDIVHLARITEARTKVQNQPPICVLYPELLEIAEDINSHNRLHNSSFNSKNLVEGHNILVNPAAKATAFMLSGSLKNIQKLTGYLADDGKEEEMKRVLALANDSLSNLFPKLFKSLEEYDYSYPQHY